MGEAFEQPTLTTAFQLAAILATIVTTIAKKIGDRIIRRALRQIGLDIAEEVAEEAEQVPSVPNAQQEFTKPEGVPDEWVAKPSDKGIGQKYVDPNNSGNDIRIQKGNPNSSNPAQRQNYVKWKRNGQWLDKNGNPVSRDAPESHIPFEEFKFDPEIFK